MMVGAGDIENDYKLHIKKYYLFQAIKKNLVPMGGQMHISSECQKEMQKIQS